MSKTIIAQVTGLVESACRTKANAFGYGIWSHHIWLA